MKDNHDIMITLQIHLEGYDSEEVDRDARLLYEDIRRLEIGSVTLAPACPSPEGSKAIDPVVLGALIGTVVSSTLPKILELLHAWVMRREERTIEVEIHRADGGMIRVKVPHALSPSEVQHWISMVAKSVSETSAESLKTGSD